MTRAENVIYRNRRWNVTMALYMAWHGVVAFGGGPIVLVYFIVKNESLATSLMLAVIVVTGGIPFLRSVFGKLWVQDGVLYVRNPFRTVTVCLDDTLQIATRPLWQNFFVVASVRQSGRTDWRKLIPVPGVDAETVNHMIDTLRQGEAREGRKRWKSVLAQLVNLGRIF